MAMITADIFAICQHAPSFAVSPEGEKTLADLKLHFDSLLAFQTNALESQALSLEEKEFSSDFLQTNYYAAFRYAGFNISESDLEFAGKTVTALFISIDRVRAEFKRSGKLFYPFPHFLLTDVFVENSSEKVLARFYARGMQKDSKTCVEILTVPEAFFNGIKTGKN